MTTAIEKFAQPVIEYPDCDGEPMAENTLQFTWIVVIKEGLEALFRDNPNVFVAGDLFWYPVEGDPTIRTAPDVLVAFRRPKGRRGSYKQWEEGDIPPHAVFEVLSPGHRPGEMARKFDFYEKYGAQEYFVYDPDKRTLKGWLRVQDRFEAVPNMAGFVSPGLGIRFEPGEGPDNLKIFKPDGTPLLTYVQLAEDLEAAEHRLDYELAAKEAERERAERYAVKLRALGIEPD